MSHPIRALWLGLRLGGRTWLLLALGYAAPLTGLLAFLPFVGVVAISFALLIGVLPATLIGLFLGAATGLLIGVFQAQLTEKRAAAIGLGVVGIAAGGLNWALYPRFTDPNYYVFLLALPSLITLGMSGWLGAKIFRQLAGEAPPGGVFRFNLLFILIELGSIASINMAIMLNFSAIPGDVILILTALVSTVSVGAIGLTLFGANLRSLSFDGD